MPTTHVIERAEVKGRLRVVERVASNTSEPDASASRTRMAGRMLSDRSRGFRRPYPFFPTAAVEPAEDRAGDAQTLASALPRTIEADNAAEWRVPRPIRLASDAVVLTVAAPFIAGWFAYRALRRYIG